MSLPPGLTASTALTLAHHWFHYTAVGYEARRSDGSSFGKRWYGVCFNMLDSKRNNTSLCQAGVPSARHFNSDVRCVTFAKFMCLLYRNQKARLILGKSAMSSIRQRSENIQSKKPWQGLPWWFSGKESACQRRRRGFNPWSRKIPHAVEQLRLWATTTEPVL